MWFNTISQFISIGNALFHVLILDPKTHKYTFQNPGTCFFWRKKKNPASQPGHRRPFVFSPQIPNARVQQMFLPICSWRYTHPTHFLSSLSSPSTIGNGWWLCWWFISTLNRPSTILISESVFWISLCWEFFFFQKMSPKSRDMLFVKKQAPARQPGHRRACVCVFSRNPKSQNTEICSSHL